MRGVDVIPYGGAIPRIDPTAWIAPGCSIIGDVEIGADVSIWYNCVVRADVNHIRIGARSNIQDGSVVHCDSGGATGKGHPTLIEEDVLVGHMAVVHGAILREGSFVGIGAVAMDGTEIEPGGMLAAGALLTPHKRILRNELWAGRPAKLLRSLTSQELARNAESIKHYVMLGRGHRDALGLANKA